MLEIKTLGGFSLGVDGQLIHDLGSRKAEALLVYLAVEGGLHNRNVLAALLWPESTHAQASTSLRVALATLNKQLEEYLDITRESVRIKPGAQFYLDFADLEQKLARCQIEQAIKIYQGDFLQGFQLHDAVEFEEWARWEAERVRRSFRKELHSSADAAAAAGEYAKGINLLQRLLELDPLDESAYEQCMQLLVLDGQRPAALTQYERCCRFLREELGAMPSIELQRLHEKILKGDKLAEPAPQLAGDNLPATQTSFIGREKELQQIDTLLHDPTCRLVSLVGPGGSGKTRLALQAARKSLGNFKDGACFVSLEGCSSPIYLISTIAKALHFNIDGIATDFDPKTQLLDYLHDRSMLLVLDGFEHLVDGVKLICELLDRSPQVYILVTSRQRLDLKSEWVIHMNGLPIQPENEQAEPCPSEAVRLFCERALQNQADLRLPQPELDAVAKICELVDGMPLGIELAAAWVPVLSPHEIAVEMEKGLDFLFATKRDIPEKHRSLRAVFDSTWSLLTPEQQSFFSQLAIFRGGFDRQAAEKVCGAGLAQLLALVDKSLLWKTSSGRFNMHNLLRQYAIEKLSQSDGAYEVLYGCFSAYYINMLTEREPDFMGRRMLQSRDEIKLEIENLRDAVRWACLHWDEKPFRKVLISLMYFYACDGWHEGKEHFRDIANLRTKALLDQGVSSLLNDKIVLCARIHQAIFQTELGQIDESEDISRECMHGLIKYGLKEELSECLNNLGVNASFRGEYEKACEHLENAVLLGKESGHSIWYTYMLWLGHTYFLLGEYERGMETLQKSCALFERLGTQWGIAFGLSKMGLAADGMGDHALAMQLHSDALVIFKRQNNLAGIGFALSRMCMSASLKGDYGQAVNVGLEGCQTFEKIGHHWGVCTTRCRLGFAYLGLGEIENAKDNFLDALEQSKREQMLPVSLYALAGAASILAVQGEGQAALELFRYVERNPSTPNAYLQQAVQWIQKIDQPDLYATNIVYRFRDLNEINLPEVVDRVLDELA